MSPPPHIGVLLLEDNDLDAELIGQALQGEMPDVMVTRVATRDAYVLSLASPRFDVILSDFSLPGWDGMEALAIARETAPDLPFIFVSGALGEEIAIESLHRGATDYVLKNRLARLAAAVQLALAEARATAERRESEAHLRLLVAELSHRVKNTLATVQSIAAQTGQHARDLDTYKTRFLGRLLALSEAHGLLFSNDWKQTRLADLVARSFAAFPALAAGGWEATGPEISLPPKVTLALALLLHELAANAVQHGALSVPGGAVRVSWEARSEPSGRWIELLWQESGGPAVTAPAERGFGLRLIERSAAYELDGEARLEFAPDGLRARLRIAAG